MQDKSGGDDLLLTHEAAALVRRSPETLTRWRRHRSGPPFVRIQGRPLYSRALLMKWLQDQTVQAGAP